MMPMCSTRSLDRSATVFLIVVAAVGVLIPLSNLLLPAGSDAAGADLSGGAVAENMFATRFWRSRSIEWGYCGILFARRTARSLAFSRRGYAMGTCSIEPAGNSRFDSGIRTPTAATTIRNTVALRSSERVSTCGIIGS